jgi:hypothetical protein
VANIFPAITPDIEARAHQKFQNRVRVADGGLQVNVPHPFDQFFLHLEWKILIDTDLDTIDNHFSVAGASIFTFFEFTPRTITDLSVGTGTGAAGQVITLPAKSVSGLVIKVNGGVVANYTLAGAGGTEGEAQITTTGGGFANGGAVTMSATNATTQRRHYVWYTTEKLEPVPTEANLYSLVIDLEEKMP